MEIIFTDNITHSLIEVLNHTIPAAKELKFAVAFMRYSGFMLIEKDIKKCLKNGRNIEFLVGLDFRTTEPKVLRLLTDLSSEGLPIKCYCFSDPSFSDTPVYHPKLYLLNDGENATIALGSSNLTEGGLKNNVEVNAVITTSLKEEIVSDIYSLYGRLKFQKSRFEPDLDYIDKYEEAYKRIQKRNVEALQERKTKEIIGHLKRKEKILPKPIPSKSELVGWMKLVYERLPSGLFRTSDMYHYKEEFRKIYPENRNIEAKIRQQLQFLRDIRLVKNPSKDRWERV
jgi:HKD family nuclease